MEENLTMIPPISQEHPREWPIVMIWYTKHAGQTIERIIDTDVDYFEWMVKTFQLITPEQAAYYETRTHRKMPREYIQNVTPYKWQREDPEKLYMELCDSQDLEGTLARYRGHQLELFNS